MDKIKMSRKINRLTGGKELLYCTRVYVNARLYPLGWREMEWLLNIVFFLIRGEKQHVKRSYLFERRYHARKASRKMPELQDDDGFD